MATDIDLTDLSDYLDQDIDAFDLLAVQFQSDSITLELCSQAIPQPRRVQITGYTPVQFQIITPFIAYLDLTNDPERIAPYTDATTTYILIGETVNWSLLLSRLVQQLGHIPYLLNPRYVRETLYHPEYRLPVTVPTSTDRSFAKSCTIKAFNTMSNSQHHAKPLRLFCSSVHMTINPSLLLNVLQR